MHKEGSMPNGGSSAGVLRYVDARDVVLGENRVDLTATLVDELLEPLVARGVPASCRHGDAEGLREEAAIDLWRDGGDVEGDRLPGGEIARQRSPGRGHVHVAPRHRRDDRRRRAVGPVVAVHAEADDVADDAT